MSEFLWYNIYIQIDEGDVHHSRFSQNNLNFVSQIFNTNDLIKAWHLLKQEYHLNNNSYFQWLQLINSIPEKWQLTIKQSSSDAKNLIIHGHHLIKGSRIIILEKLTSKELYQILIQARRNQGRGGWGSCSPPQIFAKLCFSLLKQIMLKSKIVHNYKTSWNFSKFIDIYNIIIDLGTRDGTGYSKKYSSKFREIFSFLTIDWL